MNFPIFISCPKGIEYLLADELNALGFETKKISPQGVYGDASLAMIYQLCLWSRLANRIQLILFKGQAPDRETLYQCCYSFDWKTIFSMDKTISVEFHGTTEHIRNTMFGAQVVKDAVVDYFRQQTGMRPTIARCNPQILIQAHLKHDELTVCFDLAGYSLHQRGYRLEAGLAPIKENIAAALLMRAKWPELASRGYQFQDLFCGSGTIVIEAAMIAAQIAPGLLRDDQAFSHWVSHDDVLWRRLREEALQQTKPPAMQLKGSDINPTVIEMAAANARRAGVDQWIDWQVQSFDKTQSTMNAPGLMMSNLPYGERQEDEKTLMPLYKRFGQQMHAYYQGWQFAVLTSNSVLAKAIGLRADKQYTFYNGALKCQLYYFELNESNKLRLPEPVYQPSPQADMFANRLKKNINHLHKWAKRNHIACYRVYDADLPEYAYAIDLYQDHAVLQEYQAPASVPEAVAKQRSQDVIHLVPQVLAIPPENLIIKTRKRQKGCEQYEKISEKQQVMVVQEGFAKLKVNLSDYLDTGLFLDHRPLRLRFGQLTAGTKFLNCFCYTGVASVHAALAGALTTNVDLSKTYLQWAEENFLLNRINLSRHQFIHDDCLDWLNLTRDRFDVIFLDPPSFSNSKRMRHTLDIERDHELLIKLAMRLLNPDGILYFSTNFRQFKLSPVILAEYVVRDISAQTIDLDFKRNQRVHQCFEILK